MFDKHKWLVLPNLILLVGISVPLHAELHDWGTEGVSSTSRVETALQFINNPDYTDARIGYYSDPWHTAGSWIVYIVKDSDDAHWLYKIRPDGTGSTKLTGNAVGGTNASFINASFATDGRIYFDRLDNVNGDIHTFRMDRDGTLKNLSAVHGQNCERYGRPSPDANYVAYQDCSSNELRVINSDGTFPVTVSGTQTIYEPHHDWSPDSQWLAYKGNDNGEEWVYTVKRDGTSRTALTRPDVIILGWSHIHMRPAWSPDGKTIAYISRIQDSFSGIIYYDLIVVAADDGSFLHNLDNENTGSAGWHIVNGSLSWSPDGKWIAYQKSYGSEPSSRALFIVASDGSSAPIQLTKDYHDFSTFWSPDGSHILFNDKGFFPTYPSRDGNNYDDLLMLKMKGRYGNFPWPLFLPAITTDHK